MSDVKLFLFTIEIGDARFGGQLPARDWTEAGKLVESIGGKLDGEAVEEQNAALCAVCRGTVRRDLSEPQPTKRQSDFDFEEDSPIFE